MSDAVMVPREPTDEMLRAHLACDFPAMFREHLRYPMAGPDTAADQERMIAKARKRWSAMLAASPSAGGWEEPVAWRVRGPRGGWMHSDKLPSSWRNAGPLYAAPPPVSTGSRPQEAVPTEGHGAAVVVPAHEPDFRTRLVETIYQSLASVEFCQSRMSYAAAIIAADAVMENLISSIDGKDISQ